MFLRFYNVPGADELASEFTDRVIQVGKPVSPAQVQGFFMLFKKDGKAVIENAQRLWDIV